MDSDDVEDILAIFLDIILLPIKNPVIAFAIIAFVILICFLI